MGVVRRNHGYAHQESRPRDYDHIDIEGAGDREDAVCLLYLIGEGLVYKYSGKCIVSFTLDVLITVILIIQRTIIMLVLA